MKRPRVGVESRERCCRTENSRFGGGFDESLNYKFFRNCFICIILNMKVMRLLKSPGPAREACELFEKGFNDEENMRGQPREKRK